MRHFTQTTDFTKEDYLELIRRATLFQKGGDFTHLAAGKVLGSLFFAESTRTSTTHKAAIISLGGGWVGVDGIKGTYLESGEEDLEDFIYSYEDVVDILAIRHSTFDLINFAPTLKVPVINGMCGTDEHASGAAGMLYTVQKRFPDVGDIKVGVYGMISVSRPMKALYKVLAMFGATIIEDPLVDIFAAPDNLKQFVESKGSKLERGNFTDFVNDVDVLIIVEGLPQKGADEQAVAEFNSKFQTVTVNDLRGMKDPSAIYVVMPRMTTDGRLTAEKAVDTDPRNFTFEMLSDWKYVIMGIMTMLLEIDIE